MSGVIKSGLTRIYFNNSKCSIQSIRTYARWVHRRPKRVLNPDQFEESEKKAQKNSRIIKEEQNIIDLIKLQNEAGKQQEIVKDFARINLIDMNEVEEKTNFIDYNVTSVPKGQKVTKNKMTNASNNQNQCTDMLETVIDPNGNFIYTKLKDNDTVASKLIMIVKSRNQQAKNDVALLEGKRLIRDALLAGCKLQTLFFSRKSDIEFVQDVLPKFGSKIYKMPYRDIQMWSTLTTSPGIMGIFKTPNTEDFVPKTKSLPVTIICDNVREPGNLGSILRVAAGVGCERVILTKGCVDLWDTKVLRSSCGAHFHVQIHRKKDFSAIAEKLLSPDSRIFIADNKIISASEEDQIRTQQENREDVEEILKLVPILPYCDVDYNTASSIVIIIGGETNGISEDSYRLALQRNGVRLNVPLNECVESLNTSIALGVIAFEIRRQLTMF